jgi:endoglucanase
VPSAPGVELGLPGVPATADSGGTVKRSKAPVRATLVLGACLATLVGGMAMPAPASAAQTAFVRVNQVGYQATKSKTAFLMSSVAETGASFHVVRVAGGATVYSHAIGARRSKWSGAYPYVYELRFSSFQTNGTYRIDVDGGAVDATSPTFKIGSAASLYAPLLDNSLVFYQAQRDGRNVISSVLDRKPSHLRDAKAFVYAVPHYRADELQRNLDRVGGPVDVEGGWFDAGDFIKFTGTTSFTLNLLLSAMRDHPSLFSGGGPDFAAEAKFGIRWLLKTWDAKRRVLYYQVGIGAGGQGYLGDHDVWRLPQVDDHYKSGPHGAKYYLRRRPALRIGKPGTGLPPSQAGRMAGAFALCAQVYRSSAPKFARTCLRAGQSIYAMAQVPNPVKPQRMASPTDFYREQEWHDDMELGGVELFDALRQGVRPTGKVQHNARYYLVRSANYANGYMHSWHDADDSFNLYDVAGLAHPELARAIQATGAKHLAVSKSRLLADMRKVLDKAKHNANADPFGFGSITGWWDPVPHSLGIASEAMAYDDVTGGTKYDALARTQVDWALGDNPWGTSWIVGAGTLFPHCMQHVVANLSGSTDGTPPLLLGATVDGPSDYIPHGFFGNAVACPPGGGNPFAPFDKGKIRYVDNVASWATVEPTLDYTALSFLAFAKTAAS